MSVVPVDTIPARGWGDVRLKSRTYCLPGAAQIRAKINIHDNELNARRDDQRVVFVAKHGAMPERR